ncbi:MAG: 2-phospho-L-lactate guanylyltransferase [Actinobacteria bacterium]|nr:2-phospho-L-lactate guanylyltransferase [Actinomycetota bacterium]
MDGAFDVAVVVPIRSFRLGKGRLAGALSDQERAALSRLLAGRVLENAAPLPIYVVTGDNEVRVFAAERGATVVDDPGSLNGAARDGMAAAAADGARQVIIVHADIARPTPFAWVGDADGVTIVPDRHGGGTNVMSLPVDTSFEFAYGEGSFARHVDEAARCGLSLRVVTDDALGWDVDEPDDLAGL